MQLKRIASILITVLAGTVACGKKDDGDKKKHHGKTEETTTLQMGVLALNEAPDAFRLFTDPPTVADFRPDSITSGAPDSLTVKITKMELQGSDGSTPRTIFENAEGKEIRIDGSYVDLSSLFTTYACVDKSGSPVETGGVACPCGLDANNQPIAQVGGVCPTPTDPTAIAPAVGTVTVPQGTYSSLRVTFLRAATVKGCVTGNFRDGSNYPGPHTYCTQANFSTYQNPPGGQNSDFEGKTAEEMDFTLQTPKDDFPLEKTATFSADYPIAGNITLNDSEAARLTMVIDTNRLLRFFNQGRSDTGPNPGMPIDRSYFFTSMFDGSVFVFTGVPGEIRGYSFATNACSGADEIPADHICLNNPFVLSGWLTLILDPTGKGIVANIMPDDDNTLTVLKGGTNGSVPLDELFSVPSENRLNVSAMLGTVTEPNQTIFNIPTDLTLGGEATDVYFEGLKNDAGKFSFGTIRLTRGL